jgi:hypothetical protein
VAVVYFGTEDKRWQPQHQCLNLPAANALPSNPDVLSGVGLGDVFTLRNWLVS